MTDTTDIKSQEKWLRAACEAAADCGYVHNISVDGRTIEWLLDQLEAERQRADKNGKMLERVAGQRDKAFADIEKAEAELAAMKGDQVPVAYFAAAPDYGWDMFKNKEDAIATCQAEIDAYRDCRDDGWDDDVQRVCWGVVLQKAEGFDQQGVHTSNSHHTYQTCDYSLQPELFTATQKPVVLHDKRDHYQDTDEYEQGYVRGWNASRMEAKAAIEAAGGIVKDGE